MNLIFSMFLNVLMPCFLLLIIATVRGFIDSDKMYHLKWWDRPLKAAKPVGALAGLTLLLLCFYHANSEWIHSFIGGSSSYKKSPQTMIVMPFAVILFCAVVAVAFHVICILCEKSENVRPVRLKGLITRI